MDDSRRRPRRGGLVRRATVRVLASDRRSGGSRGGFLDRRPEEPAGRLAVQALGVGIGIAALADAGPVFQGLLPSLLDRLAAGLLWLWFVNLFTFMDGIDGIAGSRRVR
ncbi:MAG: hypothetical protein IIA68_11235 [Proteobacteria bacterium]|nr:hypothetical protein [Pseudomonadota bacterium]